MAKFTPVSPTDFWSDAGLQSGSNNYQEYQQSKLNSNNIYLHTVQGLADALKNQILLHRKLSVIDTDIAEARNAIEEKNTIITDSVTQINRIKIAYPDWETNPTYGDRITALLATKHAAMAARDKQYQPWYEFLKKERDSEVKREKKAGTYKTPKAGGATSGSKISTLPLQYNVGAVKEAYFTSAKGFTDLIETSYTNKAATITNASQLWKIAGGHKGMIQTWGEIQVGQQFKDVTDKTAQLSLQNYGFQFLFNPASINMGYSGIPDVDITMYTSGKAMTNLWSPNSFQSNITFDIVLNRMFDMKYYDKEAQKIASKYNVDNLYVGKKPSAEDQRLISERGTMYDMEFLLSTTLGFKQNTKWRGATSDLGWVSAMPVELHLGKNLRYLVVIGGVNVNHVIFDERMVPILSVVKLSCQRIPDYPTNVNSGNPGGAAAYDPRGYTGSITGNEDVYGNTSTKTNGNTTWNGAV